jgi:hypothetical protein
LIGLVLVGMVGICLLGSVMLVDEVPLLDTWMVIVGCKIGCKIGCKTTLIGVGLGWLVDPNGDDGDDGDGNGDDDWDDEGGCLMLVLLGSIMYDD